MFVSNVFFFVTNPNDGINEMEKKIKVYLKFKLDGGGLENTMTVAF